MLAYVLLLASGLSVVGVLLRLCLYRAPRRCSVMPAGHRCKFTGAPPPKPWRGGHRACAKRAQGESGDRTCPPTIAGEEAVPQAHSALVNAAMCLAMGLSTSGPLMCAAVPAASAAEGSKWGTGRSVANEFQRMQEKSIEAEAQNKAVAEAQAAATAREAARVEREAAVAAAVVARAEAKSAVEAAATQAKLDKINGIVEAKAPARRAAKSAAIVPFDSLDPSKRIKEAEAQAAKAAQEVAKEVAKKEMKTKDRQDAILASELRLKAISAKAEADRTVKAEKKASAALAIRTEAAAAAKTRATAAQQRNQASRTDYVKQRDANKRAFAARRNKLISPIPKGGPGAQTPRFQGWGKFGKQLG